MNSVKKFLLLTGVLTVVAAADLYSQDQPVPVPAQPAAVESELNLEEDLPAQPAVPQVKVEEKKEEQKAVAAKSSAESVKAPAVSSEPAAGALLDVSTADLRESRIPGFTPPKVESAPLQKIEDSTLSVDSVKKLANIKNNEDWLVYGGTIAAIFFIFVLYRISTRKKRRRVFRISKR